MKLTVAQIDKDGNLLRSQEVPIAQSGDQPATVTDAPIELGSEGMRYLFVHYTPTSGKLTFSLRRKPLLGHRSYYGNIVDFDAYIEVKQLPASFLCRVGPEMMLQINLA